MFDRKCYTFDCGFWFVLYRFQTGRGRGGEGRQAALYKPSSSYQSMEQGFNSADRNTRIALRLTIIPFLS